MQSLMQEWPLTVTSIIDFAARWHPEQVVIWRSPEQLEAQITTYHNVHRRSQLCCLALRAIGVRPGDRVATLAWNTCRHLEAWYGIAGCGAVCHTLNPRLFLTELEYIINHAEDSIIMSDITFAPILEQLVGGSKIPTVKHIIYLTDHLRQPKIPHGALCYEELLMKEEETLIKCNFKWTPVSETSACGLCYTSGTTGNPKGVLYSHRSNFLHALAISLPDALDLGSNTTMMAVVPLFHANSWGLSFAAPMVGAKLLLPGPYLDGPNVASLMKDFSATHAAGVPTVWLQLMEALKSKSIVLHSLQKLIVGGSACPRKVIEFFEDCQGVEVRQLWGMTETSPAGTVGTLKSTLERPLKREDAIKYKLTQGRPHIFLDLRIVDDGGEDLPHDGVAFGHLQCRGPIAIQKYFKTAAPGADDETLWFNTGDVATIDRHGHMTITDRSKDVIKSGGEWISSIEIENAAVGHPQVAEAACIAVPHEKWGERPLLIVVPIQGAENLTKEGVLSFLDGKIAKWQTPEHVVFVDELPHTATGKISKLQLRQKFSKNVVTSKL